MRTATEKYNAVKEGKFAKTEFVRQMRQEFPQFVTQWNGFDDTVQILKNKGMIFEAHAKQESGITALADQFPLDTIDRGVDCELEVMGIDPTGTVTKDQYLQAKRKVISNLQKNPTHYYDLLAKESPSVDKNDKMKETKRGAKDVDAKNQLKKASLKEGMHIDDEEWEREMGRTPEDTEKAIEAEKGKLTKENLAPVVDYLKKEKAADNEVIKDFIKTHAKDIQGMSLDQIGDEFEEFYSVNYEYPSDFMQQEVGGVDRLGNKKEDDDEVSALSNAKEKIWANEERFYNTGDMWSDDFDYDGMMMAGLKININTPIKVMKAISDSFEDVNYHRENRHLGIAIEELEAGNIPAAKKHLKEFRAEIKKTMSTWRSGVAEGEFARERRSVQELENASAVVMQEKKGKDHDGDGDVDGDDYKSAKDKAIKKAMGKKVNEAVKSIIAKVLEEQVINEAATAELARMAEDYAGFDGMKGAIVDLQNIVTEIESFYDKTRAKIQNVYDKLGDIRNEEGLKVGGFLAPAIEAAFNKDLRPAVKDGFTRGLSQPKVRVLSQADIDSHNSGQSPLGETEAQSKQTIFTPNI